MATGQLVMELAVDARAMVKTLDQVVITIAVNDPRKRRVRRWLSAKLINLAGWILRVDNPQQELKLTKKDASQTETTYGMGAVAYEAYRADSGGKSLVSGQPIPAFNDLPQAIKQAWEAAALAVVSRCNGSMTLADIGD